MMRIALAVARFAGEALLMVVRQMLPSWLWPAGTPDTHGRSRWARGGDTKRLGRVARVERAHGDGVVLGFFNRRLLQSPSEDNVLVFGTQRAGKTSTVVLPTLLTWRGAAVATSTKHELVRLTARHRLDHGPVYVFAPLERDQSWIRELGLEAATWNPIAEVDDCAGAAELADHLTGGRGHGESAHWYLSAANLITALAVCERERGGDMKTMLARLNRTALTEYATLATTVEDVTASGLLIAHAQTPDREAGSVASTARSCLSLWVDPRICAATAHAPTALDLDRLLDQAGTLYLVAPAEEAERCKPLFSALLQSLLRRATTKARAQGGVLSPRLLLGLDEAANFCRIPRLAGYCSSGPGQGIQLLLLFHDYAQIERGYGPEEARTIWNNCRARLLLPGQGDLKTLDLFSRAIGDETRVYQANHSDRGRHSQSEQRTGRPLAPVDELRRLESSLLLYASAPPARLEPRRWNQVPHWRSLVLPPSTPDSKELA